MYFRQTAERVNVKYAYIKIQEETKDEATSAQQHVPNGAHVRDSTYEPERSQEPDSVRDKDWVYLVVSPWSDNQFTTVPSTPARNCVTNKDNKVDCSK